MVTIAPLNFDDFRQTARALVESGVAPDQVFWSSSQDLLPLIPRERLEAGVVPVDPAAEQQPVIGR